MGAVAHSRLSADSPLHFLHVFTTLAREVQRCQVSRQPKSSTLMCASVPKLRAPSLCFAEIADCNDLAADGRV